MRAGIPCRPYPVVRDLRLGIRIQLRVHRHQQFQVVINVAWQLPHVLALERCQFAVLIVEVSLGFFQLSGDEFGCALGNLLRAIDGFRSTSLVNSLQISCASCGPGGVVHIKTGHLLPHLASPPFSRPDPDRSSPARMDTRPYFVDDFRCSAFRQVPLVEIGCNRSVTTRCCTVAMRCMRSSVTTGLT